MDFGSGAKVKRLWQDCGIAALRALAADGQILTRLRGEIECRLANHVVSGGASERLASHRYTLWQEGRWREAFAELAILCIPFALRGAFAGDFHQ
jgi:hypothetical protein